MAKPSDPRRRSARASRQRTRAAAVGPAPVDGPALAVIELSSVARGLVIADAMVKRAAVRLLRAEALTPGKFLVVVVGGEEGVSHAREAALTLGATALLDELYLAQPHAELAAALRSTGTLPEPAALAIVETFTVATAIRAADRALKAADVHLVVLRLARGLGGKAYFVLSGELPEVEAAVEAARTVIHDGMLQQTEIIARPHPDLISALWS